MSPLRLVLRVLFASAFALVFDLRLRAAGSPEADRTLHEGTLPNGLQYVVLPHSGAAGDLSVRLVVHAGSLDERDDERGFAHYVEHMGFNGTRRFPAGALIPLFQQLGLRPGADLNANTGYTHTQYQLDLPKAHVENLDYALALLRDFADGVTFDPEEVKQEAPVIVSEMDSRDSRGRRVGLLVTEALYHGTPLIQREVGGTPQSIRGATPERLRAFYERNYQPNRMTLVVVGPFDAAAVIEKIESEFGTLAAAPSAVDAAPLPVPPKPQGIAPDVVVNPTIKGSSAMLMTIARRPENSAEGFRAELLQRLATSILHLRLNQLRDRSPDTLGPPHASYENGVAPGLIHHSAVASAGALGWTDAVQMIETEVRRARSIGFTQAEVNEEIAGQLAGARNRIASFQSESAAQVGGEIAAHVSSGRSWKVPEQTVAEMAAALHDVPAAAVTAAVEEMFPADSGHLVLLIAPDVAVNRERLLASHAHSARRTVKAGKEAGELVFAYTDFGAPGAIARREQVEDLNLTLASFANGVRLNLRPSELEPGQFRLRIVFPVNYSYFGDTQGGIADFAGYLMLNSNLRRHNRTELTRITKLHGIRTQFQVNSGTPVLTMSGPAEEVTLSLQLLTALLSDLEFDDEHFRAAASGYMGEFNQLINSPVNYALQEGLRVFCGNDQRVIMNHITAFRAVSPTDIERWLSSHVLSGPLEIGIVGDFKVDDVLATAASSVGTLKPRKPVPKPGRPLAMPKKATRQAGTAKLEASTALSCIMWPVKTADTPQDEAALLLAVDVMRDRMQLILREKLGVTYSPNARVFRDAVQRDFAFATVVCTFDPARAQQLTEGNIRLAALIAEKGVTAAEFGRLREPARSKAADDLRNNGWWLAAVVSTAQTRPNVLENARKHEKIYDAVTLEDVNRAAKVFKPDLVTATILQPEPEKPKR